jgi:hypothetical protein
MTILIILFLIWLITAILVFIYGVKRNQNDITLDDLVTIIIMSILGPIVILLILGQIYKKYENVVIIKRKK